MRVYRKHWWVPWAFLALPLAMYLVWVIIPIIQTLSLSFTSWDGLSPTTRFIGWRNFEDLFHDSIFWTSIQNNIRWLILFILVPVPGGLAIALLLDQKLPGNKMYKTLFYLPMTLSFVVIGLVWSWIYDPQYGALTTALNSIGLSSLNRAWLNDPSIVTYSLVFAAIWRQIPYIMVLYLAGLKNVPPEMVEAGIVDGANRVQRFWYIIFPMLKPATIIAVTVSVIDSLRSFDIVFVMTRGGPFYSSNVLANYMYIEGFHNYRMGYGSAIAVIQFAITFGFILVYLSNVMKSEGVD
jgi:multiple sugar transport system permease protein/raffinose/stachyose/melibiose transport system permease protein